MRIGFASCFSNWHTETEIADHLEKAGHEVFRYHYGRIDYEKFLLQPFDLAITSLPQLFPPGFWERVECPKVAWYFDWIQGFANREPQYTKALIPFDLTVSTDGWIDMYERYGLERRWLPHALDTRTYYPVKSRTEADVGFIGHVYAPVRKALLDSLKKYSFKHYGDREECWGPRYAEVCNSVKIMVGDNYRNDVPGYWSDRLYLSLGSGAFLMYPRVPGIEKFFTDGEHLVLWDTIPDLHNKIDYYLQHPDERDQIAAAGAKEAAEKHNWAVRISEFEDILRSVPTLAPLLDK